jgi:hypothetical protein
MIAAAVRTDQSARGGAPLVGFPSNGNTVRLRRDGGRLICDVAPASRLFLTALAAAFGPGLTLLLIVQPRGWNSHMPLFIKAVVILASAGAWLLLMRTLFFSPRVEVQTASGEVRCFAHGLSVTRVVPAAASAGVRIDTEAFTAPRWGNVTPNYVVVLRTRDDEIRLCITPDRTLADSLASDIAALTHTPFELKESGAATPRQVTE